MSKTSKEISNEIKAELTRRNLSVNEAAELLGMSANNLSNYLSGLKIGMGVAKRFHSTFGFSIEFLMTGEGSLFPESQDHKPQDAIIVPAELATLFNNMSETIRMQQESIQELSSVVKGFLITEKKDERLYHKQ